MSLRLAVLAALALSITPSATAHSASVTISVRPGRVDVGGRASVHFAGQIDKQLELVIWQQRGDAPCRDDPVAPPAIVLTRPAGGLAGPFVGPGAVARSFAASTREAGSYRICATLWDHGKVAGRSEAALSVAPAPAWTVTPLNSTGRGGRAVPLVFVVRGTRRASAHLRVYGHGHVVYEAVASAQDGLRRVVHWQAPRATFGLFELCITARDEAGRQAAPSHCSKVRVIDGEPPRVHALRSTGVAGRRVLLRYRVFDNSGRTREHFQVLRAGRTIDDLHTELSRTDGEYRVPWTVPREIRGPLTFCVMSADAAGNASTSSCAPLVLRTA